MEVLLLLAILLVATGIILVQQKRQPRRKSISIKKSAISSDKQRGKLSEWRIFYVGLGFRFVGLIAIITSGAITGGISNDSLKYHHMGIDIAARMRGGDFDWPNWVDNGWYQFTGLVYYLFGSYPIIIQVLNVILGAATGVLVYRIALEVYQIEVIARFAGFLTALFPSFIYYSTLPLKDTISLFSLLMLVLATVKLRAGFRMDYLLHQAIALVIILGLRDYLFFVCISFVFLSMFPVTKHKVVRYIVLAVSLIFFLGGFAYMLGFGFFGLDFFYSAKYFDIDYINYTRSHLSRGTGAFYSDPGGGQWGHGIFSDIQQAFTGIYFFFFSIDLTEIGRARQFSALPEMILIIIALPALISGIYLTWNEQRQQALPVMIFAFGVMTIYSSAATNMGAMFRWRMQALPFFLIMLCYGVYRRRKGALFKIMKLLGRG